MILKRQETDKQINTLYDSSNVLASIFDKDTNNLTIVFNKGKQYMYQNVKPTDYLRFEMAESQGKVFTTHIKQYSFIQLGDIDPTMIINEAVDLKKAEDDSLLQAKQTILIQHMNSLCIPNIAALSAKTSMIPLTESQLSILTVDIAEYLKILKK